MKIDKIAAAIFLAAVFIIISCYYAHSHDGMNDEWFQSLRSAKGGSCCAGNDWKVPDSWARVDESNYKFSWNGKIYNVSDGYLVKSVNKVGYAMFWLNGLNEVRCFIPGAEG